MAATFFASQPECTSKSIHNAVRRNETVRKHTITSALALLGVITMHILVVQ